MRAGSKAAKIAGLAWLRSVALGRTVFTPTTQQRPATGEARTAEANTLGAMSLTHISVGHAQISAPGTPSPDSPATALAPKMPASPAEAQPKQVRIRCIGEMAHDDNSRLSTRDAHFSTADCGQARGKASHPVPISVAIADGDYPFANVESPRCQFTNHVPATHACGVKSVATVATLRAGLLRACPRHANSSRRFGLDVAYDAGYVVAE